MGHKGFISIDFMFAIVISFFMVILVFAMTISLSVVEVVQYIVYSAARSQSVGHVSSEAQVNAAREKYKALVKNPSLDSLLRGAFFEISESSKLDIRPGVLADGGGSNFQNEYSNSADQKVFHGVRTKLTSKILDLKIPFLGKLDNDGEGFKSHVLAIMIREPSMQECIEFMKERKQKIWGLSKGRASIFKNNAKEVAVPWEDNGC